MSNTQQENIETIKEVYGDKKVTKKSLKEKVQTPPVKGGKYSKEARELKKLEKAQAKAAAKTVSKLKRQNAVANIKDVEHDLVTKADSESDDEELHEKV
jgi:hypothetical protein